MRACWRYDAWAGTGTAGHDATSRLQLLVLAGVQWCEVGWGDVACLRLHAQQLFKRTLLAVLLPVTVPVPTGDHGVDVL